MKKSMVFRAVVAAAVCAAASTAGWAQQVQPATTGPVLDSSLSYERVEATVPELDEPFRRIGQLADLGKIHAVQPGTSAQQVQALLGEPLPAAQGGGGKGNEWDYNWNLRTGEQRKDFIVCQYKVVFDTAKDEVVETAWRRRQCKALADEFLAAQQSPTVQ
ncbi:SmpA / OmlA family protein [Lampropedia hyalina DSM 16112]|jgi:outer membrane protein assembly factor BamE (lipoprotein component of BamABCDE complex)|uniref:SmpA / OmlA family protein n=1 Tax=Lampropedia hyalina DSM 16112 TaxID=1122156 RepID=A0A1M4W3G4_9BURK|nr:outer membrane protein assembly factor BamE [Lampropedia hyalina]SHE75749.1 SmpA / OmlA family protein [Lampropedia hyalina DSM 16112]